MTTERAAPRQTCTDHCAGCGRHFHGLGAFDQHRTDGFCADPAGVLIRSGKREGQPALQVWTDEGFCDKERGCWDDGRRVRYVTPVTIYQVSTTEEQRAALAALKAIPSGQAVLL